MHIHNCQSPSILAGYVPGNAVSTNLMILEKQHPKLIKNKSIKNKRAQWGWRKLLHRVYQFSCSKCWEIQRHKTEFRKYHRLILPHFGCKSRNWNNFYTLLWKTCRQWFETNLWQTMVEGDFYVKVADNKWLILSLKSKKKICWRLTLVSTLTFQLFNIS